MARMTWSKLLNQTRTRELEGGPKSKRDAADWRTEFERDFDRSVFSTPVRRLQDKAQVFPLEPSDFVRTRLTHSLEVSTVARGLAAGVAKALAKKHKEVSDSRVSDIATIAACCGLLHDIGNPPFGHCGEAAMTEWFGRTLQREDDEGSALIDTLGGRESQYATDFTSFDGNPQTLRLLLHLQMIADRNGLNLTCASVSAACKYTASANQIDSSGKIHERSKLGYFQSEAEIIHRVRAVTGTSSVRHPIAYLVEAADDIVYCTVDIEDGVRKRVLDWSVLKERIRKLSGTVATRTLMKSCESQVTRGALRLKGNARDEALVQFFRTFAIAKHVAAARDTFVRKYDQVMDGAFHSELMRHARTEGLWEACKAIGRDLVYPAKETLRLELVGRSVIQGLMGIFWEGARLSPHKKTKTFDQKAYRLLSSNYRLLFEDTAKQAASDERLLTYNRLRLVADYIAGMTDTFAVTLHRQLTDG